MPREDAELIQLKLRFREVTRQKLEDAAKANGRSLNAEIVERLEASLSADTRAGGRETEALLQSITSELALAERATGVSWFADVKTATAAYNLTKAAMQRHMPSALNQSKQVRALFDLFNNIENTLADVSRSIADEFLAWDQASAPEEPESLAKLREVHAQMTANLAETDMQLTKVMQPYLEAQAEGEELARDLETHSLYRAVRQGARFGVQMGRE